MFRRGAPWSSGLCLPGRAAPVPHPLVHGLDLLGRTVPCRAGPAVPCLVQKKEDEGVGTEEVVKDGVELSRLALARVYRRGRPYVRIVRPRVKERVRPASATLLPNGIQSCG